MNDRDRITNTVAAFALFADARRWEDLALLFTPITVTDYRSLRGGEVMRQPRDTLIAGWRRLLPGYTRTQHLIGMPMIKIKESGAEAVAPVAAWHFIEGQNLTQDSLLVGGRYEFGFVKDSDEDWRIESLTLASAWQEGNRDLRRIAMERAAGMSQQS